MITTLEWRLKKRPSSVVCFAWLLVKRKENDPSMTICHLLTWLREDFIFEEATWKSPLKNDKIISEQYERSMTSWSLVKCDSSFRERKKSFGSPFSFNDSLFPSGISLTRMNVSQFVSTLFFNNNKWQIQEGSFHTTKKLICKTTISSFRSGSSYLLLHWFGTSYFLWIYDFYLKSSSSVFSKYQLFLQEDMCLTTLITNFFLCQISPRL